MHGRIRRVRSLSVTWDRYVSRHAPGHQKDVAEAVGVNQSTVNRWRKGAEPKPAHVLAFARAYGLDFTEAFLHAAGLGDRQVAKVMRQIAPVKRAGRPGLREPLDAESEASSQPPSTVEP